MPDRKNYFKTFYVCFNGVTQGWLQGCRRVIGLDGCFLKTICKEELLSVVGGDGNNQIYHIAWAVVDVENKENWSWFMKCLIDDLGIDVGAGLTIILDQDKEWIKWFNGVVYMNLFWKATKATYPTMFEKIMSEMKSVSIDAHKHLMEMKLESWSRAFFSTNKACDAVENGISECFNALIVEARRKPIIDMLEGIRLMIMKRMRKMREKHVKRNDGIYPNIKKKFEIIKDLHMNWKVVPSGESKFEVRNAIYFLHKDPENYIFDWYGKHLFVATYATYIEGMNGMDQWPTTKYTKPLPLIVRKMPGIPPHKKKTEVKRMMGIEVGWKKV
ncbi:uncharacterized protein Tco_1325843, partial [Tanacetum coccineum]